ncbi:MAG: apolipoprotein N-acyltransferase [Ignavibacteriae bacterium]|nr:apolipoprotein N-acyltransferase [Ignavibacteriota bacterium]
MKLKNFLLYLVTGLCFGLAYPPINFYLMIFAGFSLLLHIIEDCKNYKELIRRVYITVFFFELVATSWISLSGMRESADRFLILGGAFVLLLQPVLILLPVVFYYSIFRNIKINRFPNFHLIAFPFIWVSFEYLQTITEVTFPWLLAGNAFTTTLEKIQFIEYTGVYGVSFWVCVLSVLVFYLYKTLKNSSDTIFIELRKKKNITILIAILIIYILPNIYTGISSSENKYINNSDEKITVGVIQPNVDAWVKWGANQKNLIGDYSSMIRELAGKRQDIKMIVLPETAIPFYLLYSSYDDLFEIFKNACDSSNTTVLTGTPDIKLYENQSLAKVDSKKFSSRGQYYDTYNSAVLIEKSKEKIQYQKYNKIKLVVGSERMPYQERLPFLKNLIKWGVGISSYQLGEDTTIFLLNNKYKFNTAICFESVFPGFFSDFINKGAQFSVIITNDAWWAKFFGTYQHNQYAVLRAIENRRWIVRCANTGISGIIDPYGNIYEETKINEKALFTGDIGIRNDKTFYTVNGDVFSLTCLCIGIIFYLYGLISKISSKKKVKAFE